MASDRRVARILAIDRDEAVLETVFSCLTEQGYQVSVAASVAEAMRCLEVMTHDCVLLDVELERESRGSLLAELSRYPSQTVSLILLSSPPHTSPLSALRQGAYDFLVKPLEAELLKLTVGRAIERTTLARTMRELLEELDLANAQLRSWAGELQTRVDEARRELAGAYRQRDEFIHVVAHELSGPLTALEGYAEILADPHISPERQIRAATVIGSATRRMARLIDDLASSAHAPANDLSLQLDDCDLIEIVHEQVELARAAEPRHMILLDVPEAKLLVRCDRDRIGQVMGNLMSNALKYADGGEVRVRLRGEHDQAVLSVSDRGPGIPIQHLQSIFEPHVRLESSDVPGRRGSGLGLYVAKCIAEAHGGRLSAESTADGATLTLSLPL